LTLTLCLNTFFEKAISNVKKSSVSCEDRRCHNRTMMCYLGLAMFNRVLALGFYICAAATLSTAGYFEGNCLELYHFALFLFPSVPKSSSYYHLEFC
jgi:hypothetical protein